MPEARPGHVTLPSPTDRPTLWRHSQPARSDSQRAGRALGLILVPGAVASPGFFGWGGGQILTRAEPLLGAERTGPGGDTPSNSAPEPCSDTW